MTYHSSTLLFGGGSVAALTITKVCINCGEEKLLQEFNKDKKGISKRQTYCRLCQKALYKNWHEQNRQSNIIKCKKWRDVHKERVIKYRQDNRDYIREYQRQWVKNNPEKVAANRNRRRALKRNAEGNYTGTEFIELCDTYNNVCLGCGADDVKLTADHVVPLSKGGSNGIDNIQPLCQSCNCSKGTNVIDYRHELIAG